MAIVVSSVTPASIPSVGEFVIEVTGSGFGIAAPPTYDGRVPPPAMRVRVGGLVAPRVYAISTTRLAFKAPPLPVGAHTCTVERLNADGTVAESTTTPFTVTQLVTATGSIDRAPNVIRVIESLVLLLRRVEANTQVYSSKDAKEHDQNQAKMPSIRLANIRIQDARSWNFPAKRYEKIGNQFSQRPNNMIGRMLIAVVATAPTVEHLIVMQSAMISLIEATPRLAVPRSPTDPTAGVVEFDMMKSDEAGAESVIGTEFDFQQFTIGLSIVGVEVDVGVGTAIAESIGITMPIETLTHPDALDAFSFQQELPPWPNTRM